MTNEHPCQDEERFQRGIVMIQRLWRGRTVRLKYKATLKAARTIQTFWLTHIKPRQLARSVLRLQSRWQPDHCLQLCAGFCICLLPHSLSAC